MEQMRQTIFQAVFLWVGGYGAWLLHDGPDDAEFERTVITYLLIASAGIVVVGLCDFLIRRWLANRSKSRTSSSGS